MDPGFLRTFYLSGNVEVYKKENNGSRRGPLLSGRLGKEAALALELAWSQNITNKPVGRPFYRYPQVASNQHSQLTVSITNQRRQQLNFTAVLSNSVHRKPKYTTSEHHNKDACHCAVAPCFAAILSAYDVLSTPNFGSSRQTIVDSAVKVGFSTDGPWTIYRNSGCIHLYYEKASNTEKHACKSKALKAYHEAIGKLLASLKDRGKLHPLEETS